MLKRLGWQRRWFVVADGEMLWYAASKAHGKGAEPLGRVPLPMILTAQPTSASGGFEVDLGNRQLQLALEGVPKQWHAKAVQRWVDALIKHEVINDAGNGAHSHAGKFWKQKSGVSTK